jgi:hypothetical protein
MKGAEELDRELSSQKEKSIDQTYDVPRGTSCC